MVHTLFAASNPARYKKQHLLISFQICFGTLILLQKWSFQSIYVSTGGGKSLKDFTAQILPHSWMCFSKHRPNLLLCNINLTHTWMKLQHWKDITSKRWIAAFHFTNEWIKVGTNLHPYWKQFISIINVLKLNLRTTHSRMYAILAAIRNRTWQ